MKNSLWSALLLLAPCVALGGLALVMSRRPAAPLLSPAPKPSLGPFSITVSGVETQKIEPVRVYDGFDRHFLLLFRDKGEHPKWWGGPAPSRTGTRMEGWNFWLERGGKRTRFRPKETQIWTTGWDAKKKRYFNEFFLHCGDVPTDAALKMSGKTQLSMSGGGTSTTLTPLLPFEVTLKKAGVKWERPRVSTDPGGLVQTVEISRLAKGEVSARIMLLPSRGVKFENSMMYHTRLLNSNWKAIPNGELNTSFSSFSPDLDAPPGTRAQWGVLGWQVADVAKFPDRDLIVSYHYSISSRWPLEIAFPVKKNGKLLFGKVPGLIRPRGK